MISILCPLEAATELHSSSVCLNISEIYQAVLVN